MTTPKSDYLRHALEARRANASVPPPAEPPPITRSLTSTSLNADPWVEQAVSEEDVPQPAPNRRARRPSDGITLRVRTQRELQSETEALKAAMFNLNLKLELLKKQNHELKDQIDEANKRIEELEPLEDDNLDLREDNDRLLLRMQDMEEDLIQQRDRNKQLRDENAEMLQIQSDAVSELEKQNGAVEEAADMIYKLEDENALLKKENAKLKEQIAHGQAALNDTAYHHADVDGHSADRFPARVCSIDESRPSTSHFDSDYYSQPPSPKKASKESLSYTERAKNLVEIKLTGKRSVKDLKQRISEVSMKRATTPIPDVPQIPRTYQESQAPKPIKRGPRRGRPIVHHPPTINPTLQSPIKTGAIAMPRSPTVAPDGLRALFRDKKPLENPLRDVRRPSSGYKISLTPKGSHGSHRSHHSVSEHSSAMSPPQRKSSRHTHTSSSAEHMKLDHQPNFESPEWAGSPPSPGDDLTNALGRQDRYWKNLDNLASPIGRRNSLQAPTGKPGHGRPSYGSARNEVDFLFNGNEDEDQFMRRTSQLGVRR